MGLEQFLDLARARRSTRRFLPNPVPRPVLERLLEAARWAPSAGNLQDWEFTVVTSRPTVGRMAQAVRTRWSALLSEQDDAPAIAELRRYAENFLWFETAPAVVAVSVKRVEAFLKNLLGERASDILGRCASGAMAAQNLLLAAHADGLGACCLTGPVAAEDELRQLLGLDRRRTLVCLVAVGQAAEDPAPPPRKPLGEIVRFLDDA